jgi:hypothetical protein
MSSKLHRAEVIKSMKIKLVFLSMTREGYEKAYRILLEVPERPLV